MSSLNCLRYALPPLPQPTYSFGDIQRITDPRLEGCTIQYVTRREDFQQCMGEMMLVCKEAVRRRRNNVPEMRDRGLNSSKPLSLEYLADRLDVDEPLWGYLVRHEGRLVGFVCVTTFTNYEKSFRWDSCNEAAFAGDDKEERDMQKSGLRKIDTTGELARKLQATVHFGDIWQEGIVWPRIAEISLLGALGCGRTLVDLVLEDLERMKATPKFNYDYVVLQATNNSISFYESLGFVRVGAITVRDNKIGKKDSNESSPQTQAGMASEHDNIVISKVIPYEVKKTGEQLNDIAKKLKVDLNDILFLNLVNYPDLTPNCRLIKGIVLRIPDYQIDTQAPPRTDDIKFHIAKENDTPRSISKMYNISCQLLVQANKNRLTGLMPASRLKQGTHVRVSHLDDPEVLHGYVPYAHWAFPDDDHFESGEHSYMMAKVLNRKRGAAAKCCPVRGRLATLITSFIPADLVVPVSAFPQQKPTFLCTVPTHSMPPDHATGFQLFAMDLRERKPHVFQTVAASQWDKIIADAWANADLDKKKHFIQKSEKMRLESRKSQYRRQQSSFDTMTSDGGSSRSQVTPNQLNSSEKLFNTVVRIVPGVADTVDVNTQEHKYWYVLTFIPDLRWCHLAPMVQNGYFGPEKPSAKGRPKWKLVNEDMGKELDISSSFCVPVKSREMKKSVDADKEEWDIMDDGETVSRPIDTAVEASLTSQFQTPGITRHAPETALKSEGSPSSPVLLAAVPGMPNDVRVKLTGLSAAAAVGKSLHLSRKRKHANKEATLIAVLPKSNGKEVVVKITGVSQERDPGRNFKPHSDIVEKKRKSNIEQKLETRFEGKSNSEPKKQAQRKQNVGVSVPFIPKLVLPENKSTPQLETTTMSSCLDSRTDSPCLSDGGIRQAMIVEFMPC